MRLPVDICKIHKDAIIPEYKTPGACAFDLHTIEAREIQPGEIVRLRTGLVIKVPEGYTLFLTSRSSLPVKFGLSVPHAVGIIDQDYCGPEDELLIQVYNFTQKPVSVAKGDRLVQGTILPIVRAEFHEVESMEGENRGGYGSTG